MQHAARPAWQVHLLKVWQQRALPAFLMWPLSLLSLFWVRLRQGLYMSGLLTTHRVPVPAVVVGNVVVGGSGKTPVVISLVRHLQAQGWYPGVISRGYGRLGSTCTEVTTASSVQEVGDEPALIHRLTQAPVYVANRRIDAARALLHAHPEVTIVVSDDGLQHLSLGRDLDICVFDDRGLGNGFLLPAGPLREPWPRAVDLVLHTGRQPAFKGFQGHRALANYGVRANGEQVALAALTEPDQPRLFALAAIAQPELFFEMLRQQGLAMDQTLALPDHFNFEEWAWPAATSAQIMCTEKDASKVWAIYPNALAVPLNFDLDASFLSALDKLLADLPHSPLSSVHGNTFT
jgi:tetraacyldisaccharide 4'-kinase